MPTISKEEFIEREIELSNKSADHFQRCAQCARNPNECNDMKRLNKRGVELSKLADPEWFAWIEEFNPPASKLPYGWHLYHDPEHGMYYEKRLPYHRLHVMVSPSFAEAGKRWVHVSVSAYGMRHGVLPTWDDMCEVKDIFIGPNRTAYQVFPRREKYVNLANVLHLWHCVDGDPLPDFTMGGRSL